MEELLIRDKVPRRFLGIFKLLEFDDQDVVELLKVLADVFYFDFP